MQVNLPADTVYQVSMALDLQAPSSPSMSPMSRSHTFNGTDNNRFASSVFPAQLSPPELVLNPATQSAAVTAPAPAPTLALCDEGTTLNKAQSPALVPPTLFKAAQQDIYKLMLNDSYKRFLLSPEHGELKMELERREHETIILPDILII